MWLRLGHYKKNIFGGYKSEVDGEVFFLSSKGKTDPKAELQATIDGILSPDPELALSNRCRFPARTAWLVEENALGSHRFDPSECKEYSAYVKRLSAQSISVVFSSYYMGSSSSVFGHTFLRIQKNRENAANDEKNELLDYGINYGADATKKNPVLYALFGIVGLFHGTFSNVPYYYKVREYNDYESRDLWSYELEITKKQVDRVVAHLWELGPTYFDYFFFTENCSYHILGAIEVADPNLNLQSKLAYGVIPSDTIKRIASEPGLIRSIGYRPSIRSSFEARLSKLDPHSTVELKSLVSSNGNLEALSKLAPEERARILDAYLDYIDYKNPENLVKTDAEVAKLRQRILSFRASTGIRSPKLEVPLPPNGRVDEGHGSARASFGGGSENARGAFTSLQMRFALHDLIDPKAGYPAYSQIEFLHLKSRFFFDHSKFKMEEARLLKTISLRPWKWYEKSTSSTLAVGVYEAKDRGCENCQVFRVDGGLGISVEAHPGVLFSGIMEAETTYSPSLSGSNLRLGAGPRVFALWNTFQRFGILLQASTRAFVFSRVRTSTELGGEMRFHLSKAWSLGAKAAAYSKPSQEFAGNLYFYF